MGRETLASLTLFRRAAEQEAVTAELARGLAEELRRLQRPPGVGRANVAT